MPAAERLYGRNILTVYFASGIMGQIVNYFWNSGSGGSSTAIFGIMGSLLVYIIRNRNVLLLPFVFIASAGLLSSIAMLISRDGHAIGLMVGAGMTFRSSTTGTFAAPNTGFI
jgi:membrane associated rhomboid family serine protease